MALTEEQLKVFADFGVRISQESQLDLLHALIVTLPKPEAVAHVDQAMRIKWLVSHEVAAKLIGHKIYTEPPLLTSLRVREGG